MNPLDAHRKLMRLLPVRTHRLDGDDPRKNQMRTPDEHDAMREKVMALRKRGYTIALIADKLDITKSSAFNYIRPKFSRRRAA